MLVEIRQIAVLLTCHNRREKTLACLTSLYIAMNEVSYNYHFDIYLVDDGSTDGTGDAVRTQFSAVHVLEGDGSLYWNRGMRLAWETATKAGEYDFYLWLNDDTLLDKNAIGELINCYHEGIMINHKSSIIAGACRKSSDENVFSYGGRTDKGPVEPSGELRVVKYINGNIVLIDRIVFNIIGNLSPDYTHTIGDYDYGLRAQKAGFNCYTTKNYIATCPSNEGHAVWCDPEVPLLKRWRFLYSPKGLNLKEYILFRKKFWGWKWTIFAFKAYIKTVFPSYYNKLTH